MSGRIFISYRREDSIGTTGRLYDRLVGRFGDDNVFMDMASIEPGVDFVEIIESTLSACHALVAVIGKRWLALDESKGQSRINNPDDYVRLEIETALRCNIRIIPVLVDGASMPSPAELPDVLKALSRRNAVELSHTRFGADSERLVSALERVLQNAQAERVTTQMAKSKLTEPMSPQADLSDGRVITTQKGGKSPEEEELDVKTAEEWFKCAAMKRWALWCHTDCWFRVTAAGVEFVDEEDSKYSFVIHKDRLRGANFTKPQGLLGFSDDLLIVLTDGSEHEIGFDSGNKEKALAAINRVLSA